MMCLRPFDLRTPRRKTDISCLVRIFSDIKQIGTKDQASSLEIIGGTYPAELAHWVLVPALLLHLIQEDEAVWLGNVHQPTFTAALELVGLTGSLGILLYPEEQYEVIG